MSHSPSSVGNEQPSSPYGGTNPTLYSPEATRNPATTPVAHVATVTAAVTPTSAPYDTRIEGIKYTRLYPHPYEVGTFTNELRTNSPEYIARFIKVLSLEDNQLQAGNNQDVEQAIIVELMKTYACFQDASLYYWNGVHLRFDNMREACTAKQVLELQGCEVAFVDSYDFARAKSIDTMAINEFEGQIKLIMVCQPDRPETHQTVPPFFTNDIAWLNEAVMNVMSAFGTVAVAVHIGTDQQAMLFEYRIEFHSVGAADRAVASLARNPATGLGYDGTWRWTTVFVAHWVGPRAPNSPHRHKPRYDENRRLMGYKHLDVFGPKTFESHTPNQFKDNGVVREKILNGQDVRTTIMLRNIPNKQDWMSLVTILNDVCFGTYDFVYLRIDFKSFNNVGYAFINFSDIRGMIAMLDKVEFRSWKGFKSNKTAEISYATIQGREALTQKFRNSSVMQEAPFCRPHLYLTYAEAYKIGRVRDTGIETSFPQPDNLAKLQRSMDSAKSQGLFPPANGSSTGSQRGMMSAYDRGTPRDMVHTANMARQFGPVPSYPGLSSSRRQRCEAWYARNYGVSQNGLVPFHSIPMALVQEFLQARDQDAVDQPGTIGRPSPTRRDRGNSHGYSLRN